MRKVIILGGSFDPIHKVHIEIASIASQRLGIDEVWFLLANSPRWKDEVTPYEHRYQMLKLVLNDYPKYKISLEEKDNKDINYTIDTAYRLINKYPDIQFYYLIGSDQLERLHEWKDIEDLSQIFQFVHISRKKHIDHLENISQYKVINLEIEPILASSTAARDGDFTLVDERVKMYIQQHFLYLKNRIKNDLSKDRYQHSLQVAILAKEIAIANNFDGEIAYAAGILHDCAKEIDKTNLLRFMKEQHPDKISESPQIYHQYIGAYLAKEKYLIQSKEILSAISKHATADPVMNKLDKIIYCADKLEESRGYDASHLISMCKRGINGGFKLVLIDTIEYLKNNQIPVAHKTLMCLQNIIQNSNRQQLRLIVQTLDQKKADNIIIVDTSEINPMTNYYIICTSLSERQSLALADDVEKALISDGFSIHHIEGRQNPSWVLVDAKEVVIHIFTQETREHYNLERIFPKDTWISVEEVIQDESKV